MSAEHPHERVVRLYSPQDDAGSSRRGSLIPRHRPQSHFAPAAVRAVPDPVPQRAQGVSFGTLAIGVAAFFGVALLGYGLIGSQQSAAAPAVVIVDPELSEPTPLSFGVELSLSNSTLYQETQAALIDAGRTFIDVDLENSMLRYFRDGVLQKSFPITASPTPGSWFETPAGLYEVEALEPERYSTYGQQTYPNAIVFQGNYLIHGVATGTSETGEVVRGGVRLAPKDAAELFALITPGTPILVHTKAEARDRFVYEPKVPELTASHYLLADVESNTVLAASDRDAVVPVASLTKLLTALVAAEHIDLERTVRASAPSFVDSLIPRLGQRQAVSMYSLMQLLLVESSNEAAEVIAAQVGRQRFVELMNEEATAIGMHNSQFVDPSGLGDGNVSTLEDLLRLARYIEEHRSFIFDLTENPETPSQFAQGGFGELTNFNAIEGVSSFVGGKVGETEAAGKTSLTLHRLTIDGQERLVALALLGARERAADVRTMLTYASEYFGAAE